MTDKDWYDLGRRKERNRIIGIINDLAQKTKGEPTLKKLGFGAALSAIKARIGKPL